MKKSISTLCIFILFAYTGFSQLLSQDKLALQIPESETYTTHGITSYVKKHYASDSERVRALFVWVANNIIYDVEKVRLNKIQEEQPVADVLKSRKAICQGYAELLVQLYKECNVNALLISGYTKQQNGSIAPLPHAWVAAEINNRWQLFDPTWAAGTVKDFQFIRMFSEKFYRRSPEEMIKDHMPFDPMYQFINHPLLYDDFNKGNIVINTSKPYFNYADSIKTYNRLDALNQFKSIARRIIKNGDKNHMIHGLLQVLNKNQNISDSKIGYDGAVAEYQKSMDVFNRYIGYKNNRFSAIKDEREIQQMIDSVLIHFNAAKVMMEPVNAINDEQRRILSDFNTSFYKFYKRVEEEKIFIKNYLQRNKSTGR